MDLSVNINSNFLELEENVLNEINGGFWWFLAGVAIDVLLSDPIPVY